MSDITIFGKTNFRNEQKKFGIKTDDRRRHMYLIGKTGMGKTVTMENMVIQDIERGKGVCVVDPHGDMVEKLIDYIPEKRIKDVIYFDPTDVEFPVGFNVLQVKNPKYKHLVASGLMSVFTKIWENVWSARMEYILSNCIYALIEVQGSTLLDIQRMLSDKQFRENIVNQVKDPVVKGFWIQEFANYSPQFRSEAVAPIQNKVGQFLSQSLIRNIVVQKKSTIDIEDIMNDSKILFLNLSKGKVGEDNSALLGAMLITKIQLAAMERANIPEENRKDFYLYVDEFQNFATESFADILSEARKYRLNLILAHQYMEQLGDEVKAAVLGNIGTMIVFRIGNIDAEVLEKEFLPFFSVFDLVNLAKYNMYLRLMINGVASDPFSATSLPPSSTGTNYGYGKEVLISSRKIYAMPVKEVEKEISKMSGIAEEYEEEEVKQEKRAPLRNESKKESISVSKEYPDKPIISARYSSDFKSLGIGFGGKPIHDISAIQVDKSNENTKQSPNSNGLSYFSQCWVGKEAIKVSFKPDGIRPVLCKEHLKEFRQMKQDSEIKNLEHYLQIKGIEIKRPFKKKKEDLNKEIQKNEIFEKKDANNKGSASLQNALKKALDKN
ncbi:MAG: type IV secretion system DNA-binding domain-containing protein [Patescibacteria group bacterium]